jgi:hypothetical protein
MQCGAATKVERSVIITIKYRRILHRSESFNPELAEWIQDKLCVANVELCCLLINDDIRVAADHKTCSQRFSELAYEHRMHNHIRFVYFLEEAKAWLL